MIINKLYNSILFPKLPGGLKMTEGIINRL